MGLTHNASTKLRSPLSTHAASPATFRVGPLRAGPGDRVAVTLSGPVEAPIILALLDNLERRAPTAVLIDESELKVRLIGPADMKRIADRWSGARTLRRAAIAVVAPNAAVYGLNRMFQLMTGADTRLAVFRDHAAAYAWLDDDVR